MTKDFPTVPVTMKINKLVKLFQKTGHHGFPVTDNNGLLAGVVTRTDLERQLGAASANRKLTDGDIAVKNPFVAYPDQTLDRLIDSVGESEARIPVVRREDSRRLLGVLGRH